VRASGAKGDTGSDTSDHQSKDLTKNKNDDGSERAAPKVATLGMRVALIEGALRVIRVDPASAADTAGLRIGQEILGIDALDVASAVRHLAQQPAGKARQRAELQLQMRLNDRLNDLPVEAVVELDVRIETGAKTLEVAAAPKPGIRIAMMPGMPAQILAFDAQRITLPGRGCVLRVRFDTWAQPAFDRLADTLRKEADCDRLILDLRGNPGGQMWTLGAIGGLFFEQKTSLGTMNSRDGVEKLAVLPRKVSLDGSLLRRLQGPMAVLIDRGSASCSEIFAGGMQALGRARVFGETSAGMALPAITAKLPSGDWLYYPTADVMDPKGRRIEGLGVVPDQAVVLTHASLTAGGDPAMDAALVWIASAQASATISPRD
jgi:carboxyl-terminal processing protease